MIPRNQFGEIDHDYRPSTEAELVECLKDAMWRVCSGALYKIIAKSEAEEGEGLLVPFRPNAAQLKLLRNLWHRNVIIKARQLGFSTLSCIAWLDHALFNANQVVGIVAQDLDAAGNLYRQKVQVAYDNLPEQLLTMMPTEARSASEMRFKHNGSLIRVATSVRSGTIPRLHVSEFGKICAKYPDKAREVITGSIPAVPLDGILIIESTAEGREGEFYNIVQRAKAIQESGRKLNPRDYRLHFYAWYDEPTYRLDPDNVTITEKDHAYFDAIEAAAGIKLDQHQRAWYVATKDADFSGDDEKMRQEYPSTVDEPFQQSTEGCYYTNQMAKARKEGRILKLPILDAVPCWTFWDIGNSDGTAVWVMQKVGNEYRCIRFYEAWGEPYGHAVKWLQGLGLIFEKHYLPHDADHVRQGMHVNKSPRDMLQELMPGHRFEIVERIQDVNWGIQQTRDVFGLLWFNEDECKEGIKHLDLYRKKWSERQQVWSDEPDKAGGHSEAADALRQFGQAYASGMIGTYQTSVNRSKARRSWRAA